MNLKNSTTLEVLRELSEKNVTGSEHMFASWLVWLEINYENRTWNINFGDLWGMTLDSIAQHFYE